MLLRHITIFKNYLKEFISKIELTFLKGNLKSLLIAKQHCKIEFRKLRVQTKHS